MATVLNKKNFYLVRSVLTKKLALVLHFLQDRVGIPMLATSFLPPAPPPAPPIPSTGPLNISSLPG